MSQNNTRAVKVSRTRHLVPAAAILALSFTVAWLSYTREPSDAFLFPRIIGSVMLLLAVWNFARAVLDLAKVGEGVSRATMTRIAPGLIVIVVFVFFAAKALGFYVASWLAFLCIYSLYDPASHRLPAVWVKRSLVAAGFMAIIYCLFTLLLKVQIPHGLFF